jgi:transposase-like protein
MSGRIEIVGRLSGRRRWTVEQKLAILRDAFGPDGSVRAAVERHEVGSGAIYTWRRQAMSGALSGVPARPQAAFAEVCRRRGAIARDRRADAMIPQPKSTRIFLACGVTDMRRGFDGLAVLVRYYPLDHRGRKAVVGTNLPFPTDLLNGTFCQERTIALARSRDEPPRIELPKLTAARAGRLMTDP